MPSNRPPPRQNILIVEDDGATRDALMLFLVGEGFSVNTATNGHEALNHLHAGTSPGVILLDLVMPVMDGWDFRRQQRQAPTLASIPVIVLGTAGEIAAKANLLDDVGHLD